MENMPSTPDKEGEEYTSSRESLADLEAALSLLPSGELKHTKPTLSPELRGEFLLHMVLAALVFAAASFLDPESFLKLTCHDIYARLAWIFIIVSLIKVGKLSWDALSEDPLHAYVAGMVDVLFLFGMAILLDVQVWSKMAGFGSYRV